MSTRPFRFRLERVRTVRKHAEDVAAQELAQALERFHESTRELRLADDRIAQAREASRDANGLARSGADLLAAQSWLECAERARDVLVRNLARDERELTARRAALTEALGERKALDILEARQRDEFERDAARADVEALDEIALAPFGRPVAA
jgi:flagellar export protein FliJ